MGRRVLLVEDDHNTCSALSALLEMEGFAVDACSNGAEALRRLSQGNYDELLTDLLMPSMEGLELTRTARVLQPSIRCFVITGSTQTPDPDVSAWFTKPIDFDALLQVLGS